MEIIDPTKIINPNKLTIVVLDDMYERIKWLKDNFSDKSEIFWASTVNNFISLLNQIKPDVVILDHDLDIKDSNPQCFDVDGKNGTTLALSLEFPDKQIPILIWSQNGKMASNMEAILTKKGFNNIRRIQFGFDMVIYKFLNQYCINSKY